MTKEKAIEIIERYKISDPASLYELDTNSACDMAIRALEEVDRLKAEQPKKGEWVIDEYNIHYCPFCHAVNETVYRNFCHNCGADMRGEQE